MEDWLNPYSSLLDDPEALEDEEREEEVRLHLAVPAKWRGPHR